jgi:hypothetical protein
MIGKLNAKRTLFWGKKGIETIKYDEAIKDEIPILRGLSD